MPDATPSQLVVPVLLTPYFQFFDLTFHPISGCVLWFPPTSVFIETPSLERLPPKAEEFFLPMRQTIPRRTPTRYFEVSDIIVVVFIIIDIILLYYYYYHHPYYYYYYYYYYYHYYFLRAFPRTGVFS